MMRDLRDLRDLLDQLERLELGNVSTQEINRRLRAAPKPKPRPRIQVPMDPVSVAARLRWCLVAGRASWASPSGVSQATIADGSRPYASC